jgi:fatty acid amide hydrolase
MSADARTLEWDELLDHGAVQILNMLVRKDVSAVEVVDNQIRRVTEVNGILNAVAVQRFESAMEEAKKVDADRAAGRTLGPLSGLPITVKECFDLVGTPTTAGAASLARRPGTKDADVVRILRRAGAIVIAKTNLAQLCWSLETNNPVYGRTNNPWNVTRTSGGSSGGEAAAISACASPLGIGSDSGGSVRIPSHFSGIHGFKPSSGRWSSRGSVDEDLFSFQDIVVSQPGVMARRVEDLRLAFETLDASRLGDVELEGAPASGDVNHGFAGVRVAYVVSDGVLDPSPAIRRVVRRAAGLLEAAGAEIIEVKLPDVPLAMALFDRVFAIDAGNTIRRLLGDSPVDPHLRAVLDEMPSGAFTSREVAQLTSQCSEYRAQFDSLLDSLGTTYIVCPPAATPAPPHGMADQLAGIANFSALFNFLGMPAGVVAASRVGADEQSRGRTSTGTECAAAAAAVDRESVGLPVGVQVAARRSCDRSLFSVMELLERGFRDDASYPSVPPSLLRSRRTDRGGDE